jgi:polyisoprenoid-binding protein YceI
MKKVSMFLLAVCALGLPVSAAEKFALDTGHSYMLFHVKHIGMGINYGRFNQFDGHVMVENGAPTSVEITVQADSIETAIERRDKHLRSPDFFNANQFATVTFKSTNIEEMGDKSWAIPGDFTMLGKTQEVSFEMKETGTGPHPRSGDTIIAYHATGSIKRSDYGMNYGIDNGVLADEVGLIISIETKG